MASQPETHVTAPFAATVIAVAHAPDEQVGRGEALVVLEAMKMEHEIRAPRDGAVTRVFRAAGEMVAMGDPLVEIG